MPGKRTAGQRRLCSAVRRRNRRALCDVSFHADCCCDQALRTLTGGALEEGEKTAEKFCVVVKTADQTQSLWELAKAYRTSEQAIAGANGISTGEVEQGTLVLIPV